MHVFKRLFNYTLAGITTIPKGSTLSFEAGSIVKTGAQNASTAFAGGGQTSAVPLTGQVNRITTVATAGDSVKLPQSQAGMWLIATNKGAAAMDVFPFLGDAINGAAANSAVRQMVGSSVLYSSAVAGQWETINLGSGFNAGSLPTESFTNSITAFASGGQASAVALTTLINRVTVVATAGDSVKLPTSAAGLFITVINASTTGKGMDVFPVTGDAINNLSANLAVRVPPGVAATFTCSVAGTWNVGVPQPDAKFTTRALSSSTANAGDLTGAKFVTLHNTGATPGTLTSRTGAQMIADGFYQVGDSYMLRIVNAQGTGTLTLAAGDGNVTITGTATMAINSFRDFIVTITGAATLTIQSSATGTFS